MNKQNIFFSIGLCLILCFSFFSPQGEAFGKVKDTENVSALAKETEEVSSAFQSLYEIKNLPIVVPTIVELPIERSYGSNQEVDVFSVQDDGSLTREGSQLFSKSTKENPSYSVLVSEEQVRLLGDGLYDAYKEFPVQRESEELTKSELLLRFDRSVTLSGITLHLDRYVSLPHSVEVYTRSNASDTVILAPTRVSSRVITFPPTSAQEFVVVFDHPQPLRLTEVTPQYENTSFITKQSVRFLAQPNTKYVVYVDADRSVRANMKESSNFAGEKDILILPSTEKKTNPSYTQSDVDGDSIKDENDNCVRIANPDQLDQNNNQIGDACEDFDKDGVLNSKDNCPSVPNRAQQDDDMDGVGNECDEREDRVFQRNIWILPTLLLAVGGIIIFLIVSVLRREHFGKK